MNENDENKNLLDRIESLEDSITKLREQIDSRDRTKVALLVDAAIRPLREQHFDSYKAYTTILFTALALLVGVLGVLSRIEVRDQVKEMQSKFEKQELSIRAEFDKLAGDSLRRPNIDILYDNKPVDGQIVVVPFIPNRYPSSAELDKIFLRNIGDKNTDAVSVRISLARIVELPFPNENLDWEKATSSDTAYSITFCSKRQIVVHPGETCNVHPLSLDWRQEYGTNTQCKIEVFYGGINPAEMKFNLVFTPTKTDNFRY